MRAATAMGLKAFPDQHLTIEGEIAEGDTVAAHWTVTGTHKGEIFGIPSTGRGDTLLQLDYQPFTCGAFHIEDEPPSGWIIFGPTVNSIPSCTELNRAVRTFSSLMDGV